MALYGSFTAFYEALTFWGKIRLTIFNIYRYADCEMERAGIVPHSQSGVWPSLYPTTGGAKIQSIQSIQRFSVHWRIVLSVFRTFSTPVHSTTVRSDFLCSSWLFCAVFVSPSAVAVYDMSVAESTTDYWSAANQPFYQSFRNNQLIDSNRQEHNEFYNYQHYATTNSNPFPTSCELYGSTYSTPTHHDQQQQQQHTHAQQQEYYKSFGYEYDLYANAKNTKDGENYCRQDADERTRQSAPQQPLTTKTGEGCELKPETYLNTYDTCRQTIYNNSSRSSPSANDLSSNNNIAASPKSSSTSPKSPSISNDSPALRALLNTPKDKKIVYPYSAAYGRTESNDIDVPQGSPELPNNYYPWMKAPNSNGKFFQ